MSEKRINVEDLASPREFSCVVPIQVRFNDVDILGHVNNSMYQQYFDLGRVHYFRQMPDPKPDWWGVTVVIARLEIDFFSSIRPTDAVSVCTRVIEMANRSFRMEQLLYINSAEQKVCARCESVMVGYDAEKGCSAPLPPSWKSKMQELEGLDGGEQGE